MTTADASVVVAAFASLHEGRRAGLAGGADYDAVVAATARQAEATLLTRDRRASTVYGWVGAAYELVA